MLRGELITLRPITPADLEQLEQWSNDPEFNTEYGNFGLVPYGQVEQRFGENGMLGRRYGRLVIVTYDGTLAGEVSYHSVSYGPNEGSQAYNIGITIAAEHRGHGYGTEAQRLLASYLFATHPIMRVEASTDVTNHAEQRALEKAGFQRDGVLRKAQWRNGAWHDLVLYSKLRGEE